MKKSESITKILTFMVIAGSLAFLALGIMAMGPARTTPVAELRKAAGGIGCLTGILERAPGA